MILRVHSHGIEQHMLLVYSMTLYVVWWYDTVCGSSALTTAERRRRSNDAMSHAVTESPFAGLATPDGEAYRRDPSASQNYEGAACAAPSFVIQDNRI